MTIPVDMSLSRAKQQGLLFIISNHYVIHNYVDRLQPIIIKTPNCIQLYRSLIKSSLILNDSHIVHLSQPLDYLPQHNQQQSSPDA